MGKLEVMGRDINIDKLLRVAWKVKDDIFAPLEGNIIGEIEPVD